MESACANLLFEKDVWCVSADSLQVHPSSTSARLQYSYEYEKQAKRYNKQYPGEMMHMDITRLPILEVETPRDTYEYLFVAIDDFSRELYATILPDKTQHSVTTFLRQVLNECPEQLYSDNGTVYRGTKDHVFRKLCSENRIEQRFTKVKTPRTNGKAE